MRYLEVKNNAWLLVAVLITKTLRWLLGPSTTTYSELLKLELSWVGIPPIEDELVALVRNKDPKLVFLMETKGDKAILERVGRKI